MTENENEQEKVVPFDNIDIREAVSFIQKHAPRHWKDVPDSEIGDELTGRNGSFQVMLSFTRLLPIPAIITDPAGRILCMNVRAENYLKRREWDVRGMPLTTVIQLSPSEAVKADRQREMALKHRDVVVSMEAYHLGAQRISVFTFPFADSNGEFAIGIFLLPQVHHGEF